MPQDADLRDQWQPALLDRLRDDHPQQREDGDAQRGLSKADLRRAVLRDLSWLFNSVQPHPDWEAHHQSVADTVANFGLPPLSGQQVSRLDVRQLERAIALAVRRFEPRILADTLSVRAIEAASVLDTHNMIEFEISGQLWAQPVPLEILLRTQLDLEAGQVDVRDTSGAALTRVAPR